MYDICMHCRYSSNFANLVVNRNNCVLNLNMYANNFLRLAQLRTLTYTRKLTRLKQQFYKQ